MPYAIAQLNQMTQDEFVAALIVLTHWKFARLR
jgi:hypothetical protein